MRPMLLGVVQVEVHLSSIGVGELPELEVFCGADGYVAPGSPVGFIKTPGRIGSHIT